MMTVREALQQQIEILGSTEIGIELKKINEYYPERYTISLSIIWDLENTEEPWVIDVRAFDQQQIFALQGRGFDPKSVPLLAQYVRDSGVLAAEMISVDAQFFLKIQRLVDRCYEQRKKLYDLFFPGE